MAYTKTKRSKSNNSKELSPEQSMLESLGTWREKIEEFETSCKRKRDLWKEVADKLEAEKAAWDEEKYCRNAEV